MTTRTIQLRLKGGELLLLGIDEALAAVAASVPRSLIPERAEHDYFMSVKYMAAQLTPADALAVLETARVPDDHALAELARQARDAEREAWRELYGDPLKVVF